MHSFESIQRQVSEWAERNFGADQPSWQPLLGISEEVGELCHAVLKRTQGIRGYDEAKARAEIIDAVGDIVVYLSAFCTLERIDFADAVRTTWITVKQRDWVANPASGLADRLTGGQTEQ